MPLKPSLPKMKPRLIVRVFDASYFYGWVVQDIIGIIRWGAEPLPEHGWKYKPGQEFANLPLYSHKMNLAVSLGGFTWHVNSAGNLFEFSFDTTIHPAARQKFSAYIHKQVCSADSRCGSLLEQEIFSSSIRSVTRFWKWNSLSDALTRWISSPALIASTQLLNKSMTWDILRDTVFCTKVLKWTGVFVHGYPYLHIWFRRLLLVLHSGI